MGRSPKRLTRSLFRRMAVSLAATILAIGLIAAAIIYIFIRGEIGDLQDDQLQQIAQLPGIDRAVGAAAAPLSLNGDEQDDTPVYAFRVAPKDAGTRRIPVHLPPALGDGIHTVDSGGENWRVFLHTLSGGERIAVAQRTESRDELTHQVLWSTLLPLFIAIPALIVMAALVVGFFLKDVTRLAVEVDQKGDANLTSLPEDSVPQEIHPFVHSTNRLLHRLSMALEHQRRFVADAAHELRTPVAALTIQVENLSRAAMPAEARDRLRPVEAGLKRLRTLLEQLLELARIQTQPQLNYGEFAGAEVLKQVVGDLLPLAESRSIDLNMKRLEAVQMRGRPEDFAVVARNALANAVRYTPESGRVDVSLYTDAHGAIVFEVLDTGPGIPEESLERAFDPFYRALGDADAGSGLGLALVRSAAERLKGEVRLDNVSAGGRGARLTFVQVRPQKPAAVA